MRNNLYLKAFFVALLAVSIYMQYCLWLEPGGIIDRARYKKQLAIQTAENAKLKERNQLIIKQIENLQKNPGAMEARARNELGMIKKDETFYQIVH